MALPMPSADLTRGRRILLLFYFGLRPVLAPLSHQNRESENLPFFNGLQALCPRERPMAPGRGTGHDGDPVRIIGHPPELKPLDHIFVHHKTG